MLIEFKVANHRSIREQQVLSFVASGYSNELSDNIVATPVPGLGGAKLLTSAAIYGANASGKSNVISALYFLLRFVRDSGTTKADEQIHTQPFKLDPAYLKKPSSFELHAVMNGVRMLYGLELTSRRVTSEYLVAYPKGRPQIWFERDWDPKTKSYSWSNPSDNFSHDEALRSKTRENASFLAIAAQFNHQQARRIWDWFENAIHFVGIGEDPLRIAELLSNDKWRQQAVSALVKADFGISDAILRKREAEEKDDADLRAFEEHFERAMAVLLKGARKPTKSFKEIRHQRQRLGDPQLIHRGLSGSAVPMEFNSEESEGTRRFLAIFGDCVRDAEQGRVMVVDELESSLHPILVREIVRLFGACRPAHRLCSQLLFTTHNPLLLDQLLLRRDQIWFTEKDGIGATRLYPLTDFKPRKDEALVRGYLAGRYGGIPFIPENLCIADDSSKKESKVEATSRL
jgi:uncharacterized protein